MSLYGECVRVEVGSVAMQLLLSVILAMLCFKHASSQQSEILAPYNIIEKPRVDNLVTLSCEGSGSFPAHEAVFFRNGEHEDHEPCLQTVAMNDGSGNLELNVTASCEGHYMCGISLPEGRFVLSGPRVVFGEKVSNYVMPLQSCNKLGFAKIQILVYCV